MRDHFIARLLEIAKTDPRVILITGDLGFKVFDAFRAQVPSQFLNAGVAEQNMTGIATGLALEGHIVFTYSIGNFATLRCLEQIRNDAAYHAANVKVVAVGGGFSYGALGVSHHATEDLAILRSLPDVSVLSPGDSWEATQATTAAWQTPGTCYLRLDRSNDVVASTEPPAFKMGCARRVRDGRDITLIATGGILSEAVKAADLLASAGIQCRVLSMHTVKPLDEDAVRVATAETGGIVTVEEHTVLAGLGGAIAEFLLEESVRPRVFARIGLPGIFSSKVGSQDFLRREYRVNSEAIRDRVITLLKPR